MTKLAGVAAITAFATVGFFGLPVASMWVPTSTPPANADCDWCDAPNVQFFKTPSGNIHCQIDYQRSPRILDGAYCMSINPPQHVTINADGSLRAVCTGSSSNCTSDGPAGQPVLAYGRSKGIGPFMCHSEETGMTCTANGRGFEISPAGITAV